MEILTRIIKDEEPIYLYWMGDFHKGSLNHAQEECQKAKRHILHRNHLVWGMGDYAECISPKDKRFDMENVDREYLTVEEQLKWVTNFFKPFNLVGLHIGNHEKHIQEGRYQLPFVDLMCEALDVPNLRWLALTELKFPQYNKSLTFLTTHGSGTGTTLRSKKRKIWSLMNIADADVYVMAHGHDLIISDNVERRASKGENVTVKLRKEGNKIVPYYPEVKPYFLMGSSFYQTFKLGTMSYAEQRLYHPLQVGMIEMKIEKGEIVNVRRIVYE